MAKRRKKRRLGKGKIIAIIVTVLAAVNLAVLLIFPDLPAKLTGIGDTQAVGVSEIDNKGSGKAALTVTETKREFNGKGIFNPLDGVTALDIDGKDITDKVSVAYIPGKNIQDKRIMYKVYDSQNEKLEAECGLWLEGYEGPGITVGRVGSVTWEELQSLMEVLIKKDIINGDDGFGNDSTKSITYFYEVNPDMKSVDVTFSLTNAFQDYRNETVNIIVDGIPEDYAESKE